MSAPDPPLDWTPEGAPRSTLYGDVYFSAQDGLAESRAVFLAGCGLPERWAGRTRFTVGELGFGTGLNIIALLDLWRRTRPAGGRLHIFSVEAHLMSAGQARRALERWPEVADLADALLDQWPAAARGFHRIELPALSAVIDVAVAEATEALAAWDGAADAWFLDGFAPAANPQMWRDEVLQLVAARSAPGAQAATFTVAGAVRRGLQAAGYAVEKRPGFGRKRERLEARLPGAPQERPAPTVAVVGGGIAGAAAARALQALGLPATLFDPAPGSGGSGNPAALVTPRLDAGLGGVAQLSAQAFRRAVRLYGDLPGATVSRGVLQLAVGPRDARRFETIAASGLFAADELAVLSPDVVSARLGEPAPGALDQRTALVIDPQVPLRAWSGPVETTRIEAVAPADGRWRLLGPGGDLVAEADAVILAAALDSARLAPGLPLSPVRGQASWASGIESPAAAFGGYVVPTDGGVLFGSTHDRDDAGSDLRDGDHARNLQLIARTLPVIAERLASRPVSGRASVRAVTPDRLPLAGPVAGAPPGLYALTGFGSRGFAFAPLLAEHLAAQIAGAPSPLPRPLQPLIDPGRFGR